MKKIYIKFSVLILAVLMSLSIKAQQRNDTASYPYWIDMMQDQSINFYQTQSAFEKYWQGRVHKKGDGWKVFKRWENFWAARVDQDGNFPPPMQNINAYKSIAAMPLASPNGSWTQLGPVNLPANGTGQPNGIGRVNSVSFTISGSNTTIWAGTPSGGLWKSNNNGVSWVALTDSLPTLGVSDILVDSTNTNIMYMGTGDRDAGDAPGLGVWKSTNGGASWVVSNTGMGNRTVGKLIMDPTNHNIILAATSSGVYRSTDAGANWTKTSATANFKDIRFHPANSSIVYATASGDFYRSTNGGVSFTQITSGLPTNGQRLVIGVSPANANYVYALVGNSSGLVGLYRSTNSGLSFTTRSTSPNILGYSISGTDNSSQAWYDLDIAVDPNNINTIYAGGVNIWKSTDGGSTWSIVAHWIGSSSVAAVHADQHCMVFKPGTSSLYAGCDGGLYYTTNGGSSWTDITSGMAISQIYKFGQSLTTADKLISGFQDNGTAIYSGNNSWSTEIGGDGMNCLIDPTSTTYMYGALYYGDIRRSTNGGTSFGTIAKNGVNGINESGAWVTPYTLQADNPNTMYVGYKNVWRSTNVKVSGNSNVSWTKISNFGSNISLRVIESCMADPNILYTGRNSILYRSDNVQSATPTWTTLNVNGTLHDIETHPVNANIVYVASGNNIYKSTDKGATWVAITGNIPNTSINCVVLDTTKSEAIYVGTDVGVFYKESGMTSWVNFSNGMPLSAEVTDLEIYYGNGTNGKLRASTYGRGMWSSDLYSPPNAPPVADFGASMFNVCTGGTTGLIDSSTNMPTSWIWSISPSTYNFVGGTNANSQNPVVQFNATGSYSVQLIVSNAYGSDTIMKTNFITVGTPNTTPFNENFETFTTGNPGTWMNGWTFSNTGVFNWRANSGATPSSNTGPQVDHTLGNSSGIYLYTEASQPAAFGEVANLISPCISLPSSGAIALSFWYHMYGASIEGLHVDIFYNGAWINDIFTLNGQQQTSNTSSWQSANVPLTAYLGATVKFRFRVIRGNSYTGDVAVDDIYVGVAGVPTANFLASETTLCSGGATKFIDASTNVPTSWKWSVSPSTVSFINNTADTSQNPYIQFNATGTYSVTLIATNGAGSDTLTKTSYITVNTPNALPYTENFESFTAGTPGSLANGWTSSSSGNFPWTVDTAGTPSNYTGPLIDHTLGTASGKYLFTEASSPAVQGDVANLMSPCISLSGNYTQVNLQFWYHMYGADITGLHVDIFYNGNWVNDVYTIIGQQQNSNSAAWQQATVNLNTYVGSTIRLRFRVIRGSNYRGDVAIDDISVSQLIPPPNDEPCNAITLTADTVCNYLTTNNNNATVSTNIPPPGCGGTIFQDVWFKVKAPASGGLVIQGSQVPGNFADGALAAYSGTCGNLAILGCNDDYGGSTTMPHLELTGLTPGDTIFIRFWKYGGGYGSFKICVYEPPYFHMTPPTLSVGSGAGSTSFNISASNGISWSLTDNASWVTLSPTSGSGNASITVNYSANAGGNRTATISGTPTGGLTVKTVVLTQMSNVVADFSMPSQYACQGSSITFTNTSINGNSYKWYLDGTLVSTQTNYTHTFNSQGSYSLKLVTYGTTVDDSITKSIFVASVPSADAGSDTTVCENGIAALDPGISIGIVACTNGCSMPSTCVSASNNDNSEYIVKISLNGAENGSGNEGAGYQDFTSDMFTLLMRDSVYLLQVTAYTAGNWKEYVDVFIDWNRNGLFDEPAISMGNATFNGTHVFNGIVTVPSNAVLGKTKMRIIMRYNQAITSGCQNAYSYGETEDYMVEIMAVDTLDYSWTGPASFTSNQVAPVINPVALSNDGTYNLTVTNGFGCSDQDSMNLNVSSIPAVSFTAIPDVCISSPAFTLTQGSPAGGTYSGTGVSGTIFTPSVAGVGTHWLTYTVSNANNCSDTAMQSVTVHANPTVSFSGLPASMCQTDAAVTLSGSPVGGVFSGTGIVSGNQFDPQTAGVGSHSIQYAYTDANNCSDSTAQTVVVNANPVANAGQDTTINFLTTAQLNASTISSGTFNFAWSPANLVVNSSSASTSTTPLTASQQYSVLITNTATSCSDSDQVLITVVGGPLTVQTTSSSDSICVGDSVQLLATASGGTGTYTYSWSSIPSGFSSTLMNPVVSPTVSTNYIVVVSSAIFMVIDTIHITVVPAPTVSLSQFSDLCADSDSLILTGGMPAGGTYSGYGVTNGVFYPDVAGTGTHSITYTYANTNGCSASATQNLTVNALPTVSLGALPSVCGTSAPIILTQGSPYGGTYSGNGVSGNTFDPSVAGTGTHNIVYSFTDANQCSNSDTNSIIVASSPIADAGVDQTISTGGTATLVGSVSGGSGNYTYAWTPANLVTSPNTATTNTTPLTATTLFTMNVSDTQTQCNDSDAVLVKVTGGPLGAAIHIVKPIICYGDSSQLIALPTGGTGNYTYSWSSSPGNFTSTLANPVVHPTVTTAYILTLSDGVDTVTASSQFVIVDLLPVSSLPEDTFMCQLSNLSLDAGGGYAQYVWSDGSTQQTTLVVGPNLPLGITNYYVTITNTQGCSVTDSIAVDVKPVPQVSLGPDVNLCVGTSIQLDAGSGFTKYYWSTGDTTQTIMYSGTNNNLGVNTITVKVWNAPDCYAEDTIDINVMSCVSVNQSSGDYIIKIYPNPTDGIINIEFDGLADEKIDLSLYNMQGQEVYRNEYKYHAHKLIKIDASKLAKGVYTLRIRGAEINRVEKIIIQ
jgi:PKD repeat protein